MPNCIDCDRQLRKLRKERYNPVTGTYYTDFHRVRCSECATERVKAQMFRDMMMRTKTISSSRRLPGV